MTLDINKNISKVKKHVNRSAKEAGTNPDDIEIVAVTKTVEADVIKEAINHGITSIGENRVQELVKKYEIIGDKVKWHMIGHLQRNKVKYIIDKVSLIHSLDSYRLAVEINKRAKNKDLVMPCLLQVNISGEESKHGVKAEETEELLRKIGLLEHVAIMGLMTIAPYTQNPEETRKYFRALREMSENIREKKIKNITMKYLSMGMSNDFEVAVEEGGNLIRVGSKIFGERSY